MMNKIEKLRSILNRLLEEKVVVDEDILEISRQLDELILSYYRQEFFQEKAI